MAVVLKTCRFTVDEYHRMGAAGILTEDDRVELLAGEIVDMSPSGPLHASTVARLTALLTSQLGTRAIVWIQKPLLLRTADSEPQPDVALLRPRSDFYVQAPPEVPDVSLVIAVADAAVEKERDVKLPIYARAGIPEVWLLKTYGFEDGHCVSAHTAGLALEDWASTRSSHCRQPIRCGPCQCAARPAPRRGRPVLVGATHRDTHRKLLTLH